MYIHILKQLTVSTQTRQCQSQSGVVAVVVDLLECLHPSCVVVHQPDAHKLAVQKADSFLDVLASLT